jgi:hypothetical protein
LSKMTDALEEWILQFNSGMAWFNKLISENTKRTYLPNFKKYCDWAKKNPDELVQLKIEGLQSINTPKEFQAENLLETFISTTKYPSTVKDSIRTTVISFYKNNRRPLVEIMEVSTPEGKKRCPKTQDILELENAFSSFRDRALLWFISSAPFRLETIPKLKWKDLEATGDKDVPYSMLIQGERLKGKAKGEYKGLKQNMIAPILGHKPRGVDFHYSEHDINDLMGKFRTALPYLLPQTVESVKSDLETTKSEYEQKTEKLEAEFASKLMSQSKTLMQYISEALEKQGIKTTIEEEGERQ